MPRQVLRIRVLDDVPDKMEADAEDTMEADDVAMLKHLEKNLLRLQLSGIAGISKVGRGMREMRVVCCRCCFSNQKKRPHRCQK